MKNGTSIISNVHTQETLLSEGKGVCVTFAGKGLERGYL